MSGEQFTSLLGRDEAGTSAVEFALLSPLYLLLMMGMAAYGIYFGCSHSLQQIAADAARVAIAGLSSEERRKLAEDYVGTHAEGYAFVDPSKLEISVGDNPLDPTQFVIALDYDARSLPIWNLFDRLPLPGTQIVKRAVIRIGGI
jgi:Flp pilus assembly protein TadG